MRRVHASLIFAIIALSVVDAARAAEDATPEDHAAIQRCLDEKVAAGEERGAASG